MLWPQIVRHLLQFSIDHQFRHLPTQDIATAHKEYSMAERNEPRQPTHRAYSVIRREGQDDFWLNLGLVFEHKDSKPGARRR
jgi:hypothetical protein